MSPADSDFDFSDLRAIYINCTLKKSPEASHTQLLMDKSIAIMEGQGVSVENLRAVDLDLATGVWPDMSQHGWDTDGGRGYSTKCLPPTSSSSVLRYGWERNPRSALESSNASMEIRACSTSPANMPTTGAWAVASSRATRTASSTAR